MRADNSFDELRADERTAQTLVSLAGSWLVLVAVALAAVAGIACNRRPPAPAATVPTTSATPSAHAPLRGSETSMTAVRFLENRVKEDPDDLIALNKLANYYLQLYRETFDVAYLQLALRSARASLGVAGPDQNLGGLQVLAQAEYATHDFVAARDHGKQITEYQPQRSFGYQIFGDALLELGDYQQAAQAYQQMEEFDPGSVATETRLAHLAMLRGDAATAARRYAKAVAAAQRELVPSAESIAWCLWQAGETDFQLGDYRSAEKHYRDALNAYPDYVRALASLGRTRAALGDRDGAIAQYEHAVRIIPDPQFIAALGDLYKLAGRGEDAQRQYALVEKIGHLNEFNGALYNRQLALFYADHDMKLDQAYAGAAREYAVRRDVYGADAWAWTAFKLGKLDEAQAAMKEALRLGTKDAKLFYHAGMIEQAVGNADGARDYLKRALALNPEFDGLQAQFARQALAS